MKNKKAPLSRNSLGLFLKNKRLKKKLSQNDVAQLLKYDSPQYISDWERGVSSPPMKRIVQIARVLDVSMDKIFDLLLESSKQKLEEDLSLEYSKICKKQ